MRWNITSGYGRGEQQYNRLLPTVNRQKLDLTRTIFDDISSVLHGVAGADNLLVWTQNHSYFQGNGRLTHSGYL